MRNLKLKDVSEMVITYMQDHQVDLLTAFNSVNNVLKDANTFDFNTVKTYIFRHPEIQNP